jgi:hypothetical protein
LFRVFSLDLTLRFSIEEVEMDGSLKISMTGATIRVRLSLSLRAPREGFLEATLNQVGLVVVLITRMTVHSCLASLSPKSILSLQVKMLFIADLIGVHVLVILI